MKLCECGCKQLVKNRFVRGHNVKGNAGASHPCWRGGTPLIRERAMIHMPTHPRAQRGGYVLGSRLVAEKALGKPLPKRVVIHHVDRDKSDDTPTNLVACEDHSYHALLHLRKRMFDECGHADWRRCWHCKEYDKPENLYITKKRSAHHPKCQNEYQNKRRTKNGV